MAIDRQMSMVMNELLTRAQMWKALLDPEGRDLDKECGYPLSVGPAEYHQMYEREGVGTRVVHCLPDESWAMPPEIYETEEAEETEFEKVLDALNKDVRLLHFLHRADVLSGIGRFGVLLLGLDDGKPLSDEASSGDKRKLLYLRAFDESVVTVASREMDTKSPRYSLPTSYTINYTDESGVGTSTRESVGVTVHWSRVIHLADNRGMSEVYGTPRMLPVWNRLLDIRKILGGSAEMFWRGAFPGFSFEVNPELLAQGVELDKTTMRDEFEKYANGLQRYMAMTGVSTRSLAPQVVSPREQIETHMKTIAITIGIPFRVLFGSEQAELASSQDSKTWLKRVDRRREEYVTPLIIRPTIDRLIALGVLPEPAEEYQVYWPDLSAPSEMEKAQLGVTRTQALQTYIAGQVDQLVPPRQFLMGVVGMDVEEVDAIEEAAMEYAEEKAEEKEAQAQEQATQAQAQGGAGGNGQPPPQGPNQPPNGGGGQKPPFGKPPTGNEDGDQWLQVKPGDFVVHETGEGFVVNLAGSSALVGTGKKGVRQKLQRVRLNLLQAVKVKAKGPWRKVLEYDEKTELHRVANFDPDQPRDEWGRWADSGSGKVLLDSSGKEVKGIPEHIQKLYVPSGWSDVQINLNPKGAMLAKGRDSKGRRVSVYADEFKARQAQAKFARVDELIQKAEKMDSALGKDASEEGAVLRLIRATGIRPGSDKDTKAEKQAYGATTLLAEHVKDGPDGLRLVFTGKKGVSLNIPVKDPKVAAELKDRASKRTGKLFDTDAEKIRSRLHSVAGEQYHPKDLRTLWGTTKAADEVSKMPVPKTEQEYKKAVRAVAIAVSKGLGNTPVIALQSYINPRVFESWRKTQWS